MRVPLVGLVVAVLACGGNGSTPDSPYPDARLEIGYQHPDVESYSYVLTCQDDEARVEGAGIDAEAACTALSDLSTTSRLVEGPPRDQACPEIYGGPDTATIQGTIDGSRVQTVVERTDGCGISDWDNLLVDILPPARGVAEPP